jgi:hypothetical protein
MGTRSLTMFFEEGDKEPFVVMYRQYDGYLDGHGQELLDFLEPRKLINGISGQNSSEAANGMGCLAAQAVGYFKKGEIGGIYLHKYRKNDREDYTYEVHPGKSGSYKIVVRSWDKEIFRGSLDKFAKFIENDGKHEDDDE